MRIESAGGVTGGYDSSAEVKHLLQQALQLIEEMNQWQAKHELKGKFDDNMWNKVRPKIMELMEEALALLPPKSPLREKIQTAVDDFGKLPRDFGVGKAAGILNETDQDLNKIINSLR